MSLADELICTLRDVKTREDLNSLMDEVTWMIGFRHYALIHHDADVLRRSDRVSLRNYPEEIAERLFQKKLLRRDPVIRACIFSGAAFLWSELNQIIQVNQQDRLILEFGSRLGLNEGITVPYVLIGECTGSCTFAGTGNPEGASRYLGFAQLVGIFAFQSARRLFGLKTVPGPKPKLHPRQRDCVVLAGRGCSNKLIARELGLTPRTVDGYMTSARQLFDAHDRAELVVAAVLAGEIGLYELDQRQPGYLLGL